MLSLDGKLPYIAFSESILIYSGFSKKVMFSTLFDPIRNLYQKTVRKLLCLILSEGKKKKLVLYRRFVLFCFICCFLFLLKEFLQLKSHLNVSFTPNSQATYLAC